MVHFTDWMPTLLSMADVPVPAGNPSLDGLDVLPVLRGESGEVCTNRCWQWNRYSPVITSNAAIRDGDWKLVRPAIHESMEVPDIRHLHTSMYETEYFIRNGIFRGDPERHIPDPPRPQLYNISADPLEQHDLADVDPATVRRLVSDLETWFEAVESDRRSIDDEWILNAESGW